MSLVVRDAVPRDLPAIGRLAGELVRMHYGFDSARFMMVAGVELGYERYLGGELENADAVVLAAELDGKVIGYAYGRLEPRDWNSLLDSCGALHDVYVDTTARHAGVGRELVSSMLAALRHKGAPRVVLHTATQNLAAAKLFASLGFRQTMIEMTCELPPEAPASC
jgi:ribosomal protein S18 acetylase RimI-like enzyme